MRLGKFSFELLLLLLMTATARAQFTHADIPWLAAGGSNPGNRLLLHAVHYWKLDDQTTLGAHVVNITDSIGTLSMTALNSGADNYATNGILNQACFYDAGSVGNGIVNPGPNNLDCIPDVGKSESYNFWVWMVVSQPTASPVFFGAWDSLAANQFTYSWFDPANTKVHYVAENAGGSQVDVNMTSPSTGAWHMISCGYDAGNNQIWIATDAGAKTTAAMASIKGANNSFAWMFFNLRTLNLQFSGRVDEFAVFSNYVLTATDLSNLYNGGNALPLALWTN